MKAYCWVLLIPFLFACGTDNPGNPAPGHDPLAGTIRQDEPSPSYATLDTTVYDTTIYADYVPQEITRFRGEALPGWQLADPQAYEPYWFSRYKTDTSLVNVARGDFDCDGRRDYALLLYKGEWVGLWIIRDTQEGFVADSVQAYRNTAVNYGIATVLPGKAEDMYDNKLAWFECDAVDFVLFEAASRIYYRNGEGYYHHVQTSD